MHLRQYAGPFKAGQSIEIQSETDYQYVHVGIQVPHRQPIAYAEKTVLPVDLTINGTEYVVNEKCILEFDEIHERAFTIRFNRGLPWGTIIDILYEVTGE